MRKASAGPEVRFERVNAEAGIRFRHQNGASGRKYFAEVMGGGCAFADFTGDGLPDLFMVNGARLPGAPSGPPLTDRFYVNNGDGSFSDATARSGTGDPGYGIGCCAGDYDGDGRLDLYITNLGRNTLYRNRGEGRFEDVTERAGVGAGGFSSGAAFADYDGDGDLDLHVCRYVEWTPETDKSCTMMDGAETVRSQCRPTVYPAAHNILYRNNGDGTFTDMTRQSGMDVTPGRSLGCLWTDVDEDGDPDLYVANDMSPNHLFLNKGKGRFSEEGLARGVATGDSGQAQAGMGVGAADYDGDGHLDLAVTNFSGEYLALYRNGGDGYFEDRSAATGVVSASSPHVGFGLSLADLNLDGLPDLFVANGHVTEAAERFYPGEHLAQPRYLLLNLEGRFVPRAAAQDALPLLRVGRGVAAADYDRDGDPDLLVMNQGDEPDLLRTESPAGNRSLRLRLVGSGRNPMAIGARVIVKAAGRTQVQEVRSGGSYCSQGELPLTFGLGQAHTGEEVTVRWPSGRSERWSGLRAGAEHELREGAVEAENR